MTRARKFSFLAILMGLFWLVPVVWNLAGAQNARNDLPSPGSMAPIDQPDMTPPQKEPPMPAAIKTLVEQGGQVRYLGRELGFDGWIAIRNGKEEYFYTTPDGSALLMGLLFDKNGKLITVRQVKALQQKSGKELEGIAETKNPTETLGNNSTLAPTLTKFKTPSEQLYDNVTYGNWIALGNPAAPFIYAFIDPQCPHCHDMLMDLRHKYIESGKLQVRILPIGFRDETIEQAAFLLAAPDPQDALFRHLDGDKTALPIQPEINTQGVQRNLAIMQSWHFDVTPITVYRAFNGSIKIVRGKPKDIDQIVADLPKGQQSQPGITPSAGTP